MWRRGEEVPGEQADYRKSRADYRAGDQSRTPVARVSRRACCTLPAPSAVATSVWPAMPTESSMFIAKFQEEFTA